MGECDMTPIQLQYPKNLPPKRQESLKRRKMLAAHRKDSLPDYSYDPFLADAVASFKNPEYVESPFYLFVATTRPKALCHQPVFPSPGINRFKYEAKNGKIVRAGVQKEEVAIFYRSKRGQSYLEGLSYKNERTAESDAG